MVFAYGWGGVYRVLGMTPGEARHHLCKYGVVKATDYLKAMSDEEFEEQYMKFGTPGEMAKFYGVSGSFVRAQALYRFYKTPLK